MRLDRTERRSGLERTTGRPQRVIGSIDLCHNSRRLSEGVVMHPQLESFRFSTDGVPEGERVKAVRELRDRGILPIEPLPGRLVHVDIAKWFLPGLGILSGTFGGLRQDGAAHPGNDDLFFAIHVAGQSAVLQREREIIPGDGDAFFVNIAAGAFAVARPGRAQFVGLRVPRNAIVPLVKQPSDATPRLIPGSTDSVKLLGSYLNGLLHGRMLAAPETARVVVT